MAENVVISEDFRTMTVPLEQQVLGAMGDAWVRKVRFIVPRYCDGTDLSAYQFSVHFINNTVNEGYYPVPSTTVNADTIEFDWLVSPIACANVGTTTASVSATDSDGETIAHRFSSTTYSFKVLPSNDTQDQSIIEQAGAMDVLIDGWRDLVDAAVEGAEQAAQAAQDVADNYAAELAKKADADSHSQHLTAGFADNLTAQGEPVSAEFIARESGGDGAARIASVKGNAVVWNQLVGASDTSVTVPSGHKYLSRIGGTASVATSTGAAIAVTGGTDNVIDLTRMFGQGNEPATVAEFETLYPASYYPYDAGTLLPVRMEGVETVGFNAWDEEWEVGGISATGGGNNPSTTGIRAKNLIPILPNTEYNISIVGKPANWITVEYDENGNYLRYKLWGGPIQQKQTFTSSADAHYMRFCTNTVQQSGTTYGTTYNHDICINLSHSGYRNGEYEPYWQSVREIPAATYFPDGLRSNGYDQYDELAAGKAVKRIGECTVNGHYTVYTGGSSKYCSLNANVDSYASASVMPNGAKTIVCDKLGISYPSLGSSQLAIGRTWNGLYAYAPLDADDSIFDTLTGAKVYYALATPTTTEIDPPLNLDYKVSDFGTERIVTDSETVPPTAPVPMEIAYGIDAAATLASLPTDYISHASMARFIAAVEQHFGVTVTETWDDTNKRYDYTIA